MWKPASVTFRQLEYFVSVATEGTMVRAAEACNVSPSAISLAVGQLERELDVQLFIRDKSRRLSLTQAGLTTLASARGVLHHVEELESSARWIGTEIGGKLTVGVFPTLTAYILPMLLREFGRRFPRVTVEILEGSVEELHTHLESGKCEVAIMYDIGFDHERLSGHDLYTVRPHAVIPVHHPLASLPRIPLVTLARSEMIMLDLPPSQFHFRRLLAAVGATPIIRMRSVSVETVRSLVAAGLGYSLMLQRPANTMSNSGLRFLVREISEPIESTSVVLATAKDARLTRRALAFKDFCQVFLDSQIRDIPGREREIAP